MSVLEIVLGPGNVRQFVPLKTPQPNGDDQEKNDQKMTVSHSEACVPRVPWKFAEERFRTGRDTCHRGHI